MLQPRRTALALQAVGLGFAAIAAAGYGIYVHPHGLVVLAGILALLTIGVVWPWLSLRFVTASISFDRTRATEGQSIIIRIAIRNRWPVPIWGLGLGGMGVDDDLIELIVRRMGPWQTQVVTQPFIPSRRGKYPLRAAYLASGFPFGLWHPRKTVQTARDLLVWPATVAAHSMDASNIRPAAEPSQSAASCSSREGAPNGGVRRYRPGDSMRLVNWRQTAKHERLIVKELAAASVPRVHIVLDADAAHYADLGKNGPREWAIRIAASLFVAWEKENAHIRMTIGGETFGTVRGLSGLRRRVFDALAVLPNAPIAPAHPSTLKQRSGAGEILLAITSSQSFRSSTIAGRSGSPQRVIMLPPKWSEPIDSENCGDDVGARSVIRIESPHGISSRLCSL